MNRALPINTSSVALKEWAVTVRALGDGDQIFLLRKGGLREEDKDFQVLYDNFLLYPTYEHQRRDLLKESHTSDMSLYADQGTNPQYVTFSHWSRVEEVIELSNEASINNLHPYHIWSADYAQKRLHWKPRKPLHLMLLRVYRLEESQDLPYVSEYSGCKSWVHLKQEIQLGQSIPVMSDQSFQRALSIIRDACSY